MQPGLRRTRRDIQHGGRCLFVQSFEVSQHQDRPVFGRQPLEHVLYVDRQLRIVRGRDIRELGRLLLTIQQGLQFLTKTELSNEAMREIGPATVDRLLPLPAAVA